MSTPITNALGEQPQQGSQQVQQNPQRPRWSHTPYAIPTQQEITQREDVSTVPPQLFSTRRPTAPYPVDLFRQDMVVTQVEGGSTVPPQLFPMQRPPASYAVDSLPQDLVVTQVEGGPTVPPQFFPTQRPPAPYAVELFRQNMVVRQAEEASTVAPQLFPTQRETAPYATTTQNRPEYFPTNTPIEIQKKIEKIKECGRNKLWEGVQKNFLLALRLFPNLSSFDYSLLLNAYFITLTKQVEDEQEQSALEKIRKKAQEEYQKFKNSNNSININNVDQAFDTLLNTITTRRIDLIKKQEENNLHSYIIRHIQRIKEEGNLIKARRFYHEALKYPSSQLLPTNYDYTEVFETYLQLLNSKAGDERLSQNDLQNIRQEALEVYNTAKKFNCNLSFGFAFLEISRDF